MQKEKTQTFSIRKRSLTRLLAVQIFYQFDFYKQSISLEEIKNDLIDNYIFEDSDEISSYRNKIDLDFLNILLFGIQQKIEEIDNEITEISQYYSKLDKSNSMLIEILRFANLELKSSNIDFKIIVNEYVDIASYFFDNSQVNFINSILEKFAIKIREDGK